VLDALVELGFEVVGYGCTTCIGNSGPLPEAVVQAITSADLVAAAVLSGNRNFEGRIHPYVRANFLCLSTIGGSVCAAGRVDLDLVNEPLGMDQKDQPVYLREIWPSNQEIQQAIAQAVQPQMFEKKYANVFSGNETWNAIQFGEAVLFPWEADSTYHPGAALLRWHTA